MAQDIEVVARGTGLLNWPELGNYVLFHAVTFRRHEIPQSTIDLFCERANGLDLTLGSCIINSSQNGCADIRDKVLVSRSR